ncbi:hypothetical protein TKK_0013862 [Trichogramma kaykai]
MDKLCEFCGALKFENEPPRMCCVDEKVKLPELTLPPESLLTLVTAKILDSNINPELFKGVRRNIIHGPCGIINNNPLCMKNGKCSKHFPRNLQNNTITRGDGYPKYRQRSTNAGEKSITITLHNCEVEIDNRWT